MTFTIKPRIVELCRQTYKPLVSWVREEKVHASVFPFLTCGSMPVYINMKAIGRCTVNGVEMEFADVRVYATPPTHVERAIASEGGQGG